MGRLRTADSSARSMAPETRMSDMTGLRDVEMKEERDASRCPELCEGGSRVYAHWNSCTILWHASGLRDDIPRFAPRPSPELRGRNSTGAVLKEFLSRLAAEELHDERPSVDVSLFGLRL